MQEKLAPQGLHPVDSVCGPQFDALMRRQYGEYVRAVLAANAVREAVEKLRAAGCDAIAVVFLFSFINPKHGLRVAGIIGELYPEAFVSVSAKVNPEFREYERASTTVIDAYARENFDADRPWENYRQRMLKAQAQLR